MAKLTFFPVENGDTTLIEFGDGRLMLVDYCHRAKGEDDCEPCIDLASSLGALLAELGREYIDVVVLTHRHDDHVAGAEAFFSLDHAAAYQGDGRIAIGELWVPASMVLATGLAGSARVMREEARHRIKQGSGVRIFSAPGALDDIAADLGVSEEEMGALIVGAGEIAPGWTADDGEVEVFVHSPFAANCEPEAEEEDTNGSSIILHLTFFPGENPTPVLLGADAEWEVWKHVVELTEQNGNDTRLDWDVFKVAHHCSYTALAQEAGDGETVPEEGVDRLFDHAQNGAIVVASSNPIACEGTPPHEEAASYYRSIAANAAGQFFVTMEYPSQDAPEPLVIEIGEYGPAEKRSESARWSGAGAVIGSRSSRYGPQ
jgi:hypothetical protein